MTNSCVALHGFLRAPGKAFGSTGPGRTHGFPLSLSWVSAGCSYETGAGILHVVEGSYTWVNASAPPDPA